MQILECYLRRFVFLVFSNIVYALWLSLHLALRITELATVHSWRKHSGKWPWWQWMLAAVLFVKSPNSFNQNGERYSFKSLELKCSKIRRIPARFLLVHKMEGNEPSQIYCIVFPQLQHLRKNETDMQVAGCDEEIRGRRRKANKATVMREDNQSREKQITLNNSGLQPEIPV